jgi:hypothetical protein
VCLVIWNVTVPNNWGVMSALLVGNDVQTAVLKLALPTSQENKYLLPTSELETASPNVEIPKL